MSKRVTIIHLVDNRYGLFQNEDNTTYISIRLNKNHKIRAVWGEENDQW